MKSQTIVLILANGLTNGGVTTWALNTGKRLKSSGHSCLIISHKPAQGYREFSVEDASSIVKCPINASDSLPNRRETKIISTAYEAISDCVIFPNWSWGTWAGVAALKRRKMHASRIVGIAHTDEEDYYEILVYYEKIISKFIAVSDCIYDELIRRIPQRSQDIIRLSYPITNRIGTPRTPKRDALKIGYAGRIQDYQKRISDIKPLVDKLAALPGSYCIDVAGDGTHLPELKQYFECNHYGNISIRFHGLIPSEKMLEFWSNMDVAILFSSHEGLSISMIESMAAGCVQMVTNVSGVSDSVEHGISGFIHEIGDTAAMANHLYLLHQDPELLSKMSEACISHVKQHHDPDHYDAVLLRLCRQSWEQPQRCWPRFKSLIPQKIKANLNKKNRFKSEISLKGRIKLKLIGIKNSLFH